MFYTDELRRLRPIAWLVVSCLIFWAVMFFAWPFWTGALIAVAFGILGSYLFGAWIRERLRNRMKTRDTGSREKLQDWIDEVEEARDRARRRP